jgi:hypothetical protein
MKVVPRKMVPPRKLEVVPLTKADLARLYEPRKANVVTKLRDSHHFLARLYASGLDNMAVAARTGYSVERLRRIRRSPAFDNLVAEYRQIVTAEWADTVDDYYEIAAGNMVRAELQIADKLEAAEEDPENNPIPVRDLLAISRDSADRFGYPKKGVNVNVNADFASMLEKAIKRSGKTIEGSVAPLPAGSSNGDGGGSGSAPPAPIPFRRRT